MQVDNVQRLTAGQRSEVLALVEAATVVDEVSPLSEQVLLAVRGDPTDATTSTPPTSISSSWPHFLGYAGTYLAGYAHLERGLAGEAATGEVVVAPASRRQGVGTELIHALEAALAPEAVAPKSKAATQPRAAVALRLWSHGHLDGARALAARDGYSIVRELWQMSRPLRSQFSSWPDAGPLPAGDSPLPAADSLPAVSLPGGFATRHFVVGRDEDAWLQVNARAFVDHPEQGRMTRHDLDQRIAEPWFDPGGFILIEDARARPPALAASHWTKVVQAADPKVSPTEGEVYVVGVDPAYQGLGLGRAVTILGLEYLREQGLTEARLYVDADNRAAVATYARLGFTRCAVDVMYSRVVHPPV